jgi:pimeloyl-ACP methyl ester carboxylesterase
MQFILSNSIQRHDFAVFFCQDTFTMPSCLFPTPFHLFFHPDSQGGYDHIQRTRPQTLAYGLNDSPAGLAAWIIEKWYVWTDPPTRVLHQHFTRDQLLANVMIYWVTETINSANRLYDESAHAPRQRRPEDRIQVPTGVALTTQQIERAPREYLQRIYTDIRSWIDFGRGGHFILLEEPQLVAEALRAFFRPLRHQPA